MGLFISIGTVICFSFFIGVVFYAYSKKQQASFAEAAHLPFDVPDEFAIRGQDNYPSTLHPGR